MGRILAILMAVVMVLSLTACGNETVVPDDTTETTSVSSVEMENDTEVSSDDATGTTVVSSVQTQEKASSKQENTQNTAWRQFLKDYEAWVDDYVNIVNKYKQNPTDMTILADYTEMMSDMVEWSSRAEDIQDDLSADDLQEYLATLGRIIEKLSEVAY